MAREFNHVQIFDPRECTYLFRVTGNTKIPLSTMEKMTQVMVQNKAASIKADVKKNMTSILGENEEEKEIKESRKRQDSVKEMGEQREKAKQERDEEHRKKNEEREKLRSNIRDKYKLKGSKHYDGQYHQTSATDSKFAENTENLQSKKKDSCCVQ